MRLLTFPLAILALCLSSCYEDVAGCLDPEATNYDLRADEECDQCCSFPEINLRNLFLYDGEEFSTQATLTDGAGNDFRLLRLRYYLGNVELQAESGEFITPGNFVEVGRLIAGDTLFEEINANLFLARFPQGSTGSVGAFASGREPITTLWFNLGLPPTTANIIPTTAPASSPLTTQPGLLNFNDGDGYLLGSYEYVLLATDDTLRVDLRGSEPVEITFPQPIRLRQGSRATVELTTEVKTIFDGLDLTADPTTQRPIAIEALQNSFSASIGQ